MYNYEELKDKYGDLYIEQLVKESNFRKTAQTETKNGFDKAKAEGTAATTKLGQHYIKFAYQKSFDAVKLFVEKALEPKAGAKSSYVGVLSDLYECYKNDPNELYDLLTMSTISNLISLAITNGGQVIMSNATKCIGVEIKDEYDLKRFSRVASCPDSLLAGVDKRVRASYKRTYIRKKMKDENFAKVKWDNTAVMGLCAQVIHVVSIASGYFEVAIPMQHDKITVVELTKYFMDSWKKNEERYIASSYTLCPTIIPPAEWSAYDNGGYYGELRGVSTFLRIYTAKTAFGQQYLKKLSQMELTKIYKAINAIQATPWVINRKVLAVVKKLVELGGGRAGLPYFDEAPKPMVLPENPTQEQLIKYKEVMSDWYRSETRRNSIVWRCNSHLNIAEEFAKYDRIYFPCNMDFRGRVYPIPSFNFQGDDLNKGLILFADAPACQDMDDIHWLMVQGSYAGGYDKESYPKRWQWVLDHEQEILASAADPIGYDWWQNQKKPFQMLSFCFAWADWKQWEKEHNGDPKGFVCGIPIAMDGTCSGLQHFSAILRDPIGGHAVNLVPSDKPNDIYGIVAEKVNKILDKDICSGTGDEMQETRIKYGTKTLAQTWRMYGVDRSVTKRSTMTLAYGSKEYGFRDQLMEDIIEPDIIEHGDQSPFNKYNKWQASAYMAKLIWNAVGQTVVKAVEGMKWLQTCAKMVAKGGHVVTWITPMGLPVQQSYLKSETKVVRMRCAGKFLRLYDSKKTGDVDKSAQASGIAPNFIHSMDASHLQLTVCNAVDAGIHHFAMIHDSYGSPVAQAKIMYKVVRASFVQMYTENDVLNQFREDMQMFSDKVLPPPPSRGTLDIKDVLNSEYIFC